MIDTTLALAVIAMPQRIVTAFQTFTMAGVVLLVCYGMWKVIGFVRVQSLADKARKAEQMRREDLRAKMQPRYTPPPSARSVKRPAPRGR
jgi:hypothetical protein